MQNNSSTIFSDYIHILPYTVVWTLLSVCVQLGACIRDCDGLDEDGHFHNSFYTYRRTIQSTIRCKEDPYIYISTLGFARHSSVYTK